MRGRERQSGFTLTEMIVSVAVFSVALAVLFGFMGPAFEATNAATTLSRLGQDGDRAMSEILDELLRAEDAALAHVRAPLSTRSVSYRHPAGTNDTAVVWSGLRTLEFEYEPGDPDDGLDNNGNGLVDEGRVVLRTDVGGAGERTRVVVRGVPEYLQGEVLDGADNNGNQLQNEAGFCLDHDAASDTWTVRLTLARQNPRGQWFWRTFETSIAPRN